MVLEDLLLPVGPEDRVVVLGVAEDPIDLLWPE
jgi:hypothetical protein